MIEKLSGLNTIANSFGLKGNPAGLRDFLSPGDLALLGVLQTNPDMQKLVHAYDEHQALLKNNSDTMLVMFPDGNMTRPQHEAKVREEAAKAQANAAHAGVLGAMGAARGQDLYPNDPQRQAAYAEVFAALGEMATAWPSQAEVKEAEERTVPAAAPPGAPEARGNRDDASEKRPVRERKESWGDNNAPVLPGGDTSPWSVEGEAGADEGSGDEKKGKEKGKEKSKEGGDGTSGPTQSLQPGTPGAATQSTPDQLESIGPAAFLTGFTAVCVVGSGAAVCGARPGPGGDDGGPEFCRNSRGRLGGGWFQWAGVDYRGGVSRYPGPAGVRLQRRRGGRGDYGFWRGGDGRWGE